MNNSYFVLDFLSLPLTIAVALPFTPNDEDLSNYNTLWSVLEDMFSVHRTDFYSVNRITQKGYDDRVVKLDFRVN